MQIPTEVLSPECQAILKARAKAVETLKKLDDDFEAQFLKAHEAGTRTAVKAKIASGELKSTEADPDGDILFGHRFGRFSVALVPKKDKKASAGKNAITF